MNWILFIALGAGCGWISAQSQGGKKGGDVLGSMTAGAIAAVLIGLVVTFVFSFLFFIVKVLCVVFGVLVLLALLGAGKSD